MLLLADTWADASEWIALFVCVAAVLIVAMLCGWKPWAQPSFWERIHGSRESRPPDGTAGPTD
jgi:hypothetical protein